MQRLDHLCDLKKESHFSFHQNGNKFDNKTNKNNYKYYLSNCNIQYNLLIPLLTSTPTDNADDCIISCRFESLIDWPVSMAIPSIRLPSHPDRISMSCGYGRRGSPESSNQKWHQGLPWYYLENFMWNHLHLVFPRLIPTKMLLKNDSFREKFSML